MWVVMLAARFRAAWSLTSDASEETGSIRVARRLRLSAWARPTAALRERERARACAA